jgi:transketolase N-terminal domain/subunit
MNDLEKHIVELSYRHKLTHVSSCLNCVNLLDWIYEQRQPGDPVVLDNSHAALALYVVLEKYGYCDAEDMVEKHGTHAGRDMDHGIYVSGGSLGQPATVAVGLALADKNRKVWIVTSDGSCMEGATQEALRLADKYCRTNLEAFVVYNGYGAYGQIHSHELPHFSILRTYYVDQLRYPEWLKGLNGHYLVLSEAQRDELMR